MIRSRLLIGCLILSCALVPVDVLAVANNVSRLGSVGLQVVPVVTGELVVLQLADGSPAFRAGLKPGDLLVKVDNFSLRGSEFAEVVSKHLWGPEGSEVVLRYLRPGKTGLNTVILRRSATDPKLTVTPALRNAPPAKVDKP